MRFVYTLLFALVAQASLFSQLVIDTTSAPRVGDEWAVGLVVADTSDFPFPVAGTTGVVYNFTALGDFPSVTDSTVAIRDVPLDSLVPFRILPLPTAAEIGSGELPDFPPNTVTADDDIFKLFGEAEGDFYEPQFLTTRDSGVFLTGVGCYEEGEFLDLTVDTVQAELQLPFGLTLGDTLIQRLTFPTFDTDQQTNDTLRVFKRFEYVSSGSLNTHFGTFDDIAVFRVEDVSDFKSVRIDGALDVQITIEETYFAFYRSGSYEPVLRYNFNAERDSTGALRDPEIFIAYYQAVNLVDVAERDARELRLTAFPNPTTQRASVAFSLERPATVVLSLLTVDGRLLRSTTHPGLRAGPQQLDLEIPRSVPGGTYLLRVTDGRRATARPLIVKR